MGIIVLFSSFDSIGLKKQFLGELSENSTVYNGFEPNWYMDYGKNICTFIFMSSFVVNSRDLGKWTMMIIVRCLDRKGRLNLKLDPEDEDCDKPNSRIRI